jgi:cysteine desulfurase/selenocysteine lyase
LDRLGLRERYLLDPDILYFNHASIGTVPRAVHESRVRYLEVCESNPWLHMWGGVWEEPREETRAKTAAYLGCLPDEVAITHNATEGFNLLAQGLPLGPGDEVVFSSLNHAGASICWEHHAETKGYTVHRFGFPILEVPSMTVEDVLNVYDREIRPNTRMLVFPHIDNIVGLRYPVRELAALARSKGVEFVAVDGAQSMGMIPLDMRELGVDFYASSPHKWVQSPKGLGVLYVSETVRDMLRPMWVTWGQQRWSGSARLFEDYGTRNLPEVITLGDAIDFQNQLGAAEKEARYRELWSLALDLVDATPELVWHSPTDWSLSGSLYSIEVRGKDSTDLFRDLYGEQGTVFRPFNTQGLNSSRISPNVITTDEELERLLGLMAARAG